MDIIDIFLLVLGFALGLFGNIFIIYWQFEKSIASYRVDKVSNATKEFKSRRINTERLRSKYRSSLGIIIDDLISMNDDGLKHDQRFLMLVDKDDNRRTKFDTYVRPVWDDINPYSFLGSFDRIIPIPKIRTRLRKLNLLANLCQKLETVVDTLDEALANPPVIQFDATGDFEPVNNFDKKDERVIAVIQAHKDLAIAWKDWRIFVAPDSPTYGFSGRSTNQ